MGEAGASRSAFMRLCLLSGALMVVFLLLAGLLALAGFEGSLKVFLLAFLGPVTLLFPALLAGVLREPGWFRSGDAISAALLFAGGFLFALGLVIWMPWAPAQFFVEEMPAVARLPFMAGMALVVGSVLVGGLSAVVERFRRPR